jgi:hypothetical protein
MVIISNCEHLSLGFCEMGLIEGGAQLSGVHAFEHFLPQTRTKSAAFSHEKQQMGVFGNRHCVYFSLSLLMNAIFCEICLGPLNFFWFLKKVDGPQAYRFYREWGNGHRL